MENDKSTKISSNDILNAIDLDKIDTGKDKRKRGRPKKAETVKNISKVELSCVDDDEIILRLPLTIDDLNILNDSILEESEYEMSDNNLKNSKNNTINKCEESDNYTNATNDEINTYVNEDTDDIKKIKKKEKNEIMEFSNMNINQLCSIIVRQTKENKQLKSYINDITPMFCTEVNEYPISLYVCDENGNIIVPKRTNLCCWWCTCTFTNIPVYIPEKYHDGKYYVFGNCCDFSCAAAYINDMRDSRVLERYTLLKQIFYIIHKENIKSIKDIEINLADNPKKLTKFGGPQSIDDFRKNSKILNKEYYNMIPPLGGINITCSEVTNSSNVNNINVYNYSLDKKSGKKK